MPRHLGTDGHFREPLRSSPVIWVEEDESLAKSVGSYLGEHRVTVRVQPDLSQAIAAILRDPPDVVLLAASGSSTIDACRVVRRRSDAPIIVTTAEDGESDRVLGLEAGADDWLSKPFSPASCSPASERAPGASAGSSVLARSAGLDHDRSRGDDRHARRRTAHTDDLRVHAAPHARRARGRGGVA